MGNERKSTMICKRCHMGVMKQHHTLLWWIKCETCGFCQQVPLDRLTKANREIMKKSPMAEHIIKPYKG
jgi:hypothetical protein